MKVLVTGGAGYIGSHAVRKLIEAGHEVVVLDNLSHGHAAAVRAAAPHAAFVEGDVSDPQAVDRAHRELAFEAVLHFAAFIEVGESVIDPAKYYSNNFCKTFAFLDHLRKIGVKKIVFSSTAAVYGNPDTVPIDENASALPINPYGRTKRMVELALEDFRAAYGFSYAILRYFNVGGASPDGALGEAHEPETHLIPRVLGSLLDSGSEMKVFGNDYPTRDGTCIRDYVHVEDLAQAHVLALKALGDAKGSIYNIGSQNGFSVFEVLKACEKVTGQKVGFTMHPRRPGDPPSLVASSEKIRRELGWNPQFENLETLVRHAWNWHRSHPKGYRS